MEKVQYSVSGILNPQTKTQVKNVLDELIGVQSVNIDLGKSWIEIEYNSPADENEIRHCIEHVGWTVE